MAVDVLVPRKVADILDDPDERGLQFMLHAEAELRHSRCTIGLRDVGEALSEERLCGGVASDPARAGVGHVDVARAWVVEVRRRGGSVVDVVALHALEEGSEAAAENGFAVAEEIFRESNTRLQVL